MSFTYTIADLHGRWDLYILALAEIYKRVKDSKDKATILILGDMIDRGPGSAQIIESARKLEGEFAEAKDDQINLKVLMGNHEDMMVETLTKPLKRDWWYGNGGDRTMDSYAKQADLEQDMRLFDDVRWLANLPTYHEDDKRIYVHAGVDPLVSMAKQERDTLLWKLYNNNTDVGHFKSGKHVVHGHHQFARGPRLYQNRTNLDTFAWATGRLVVGVFDDNLPGGPVDLIEITGPPDKDYLKTR